MVDVVVDVVVVVVFVVIVVVVALLLITLFLVAIDKCCSEAHGAHVEFVWWGGVCTVIFVSTPSPTHLDWSLTIYLPLGALRQNQVLKLGKKGPIPHLGGWERNLGSHELTPLTC